MKQSTDKQRSDAILNYFHAHPFIAPSKVAKSVGYDPAALSRLINRTGRLTNIPLQYINPIEAILKKYGY